MSVLFALPGIKYEIKTCFLLSHLLYYSYMIRSMRYSLINGYLIRMFSEYINI